MVKNYKDVIPLFYNVMAALVLMCGSENGLKKKMGRRTIETADISGICLCMYTFPRRPYLATYDIRMQGYEVKWYEYFRCIEAEGINQDIIDHATKNSKILEDLQDD
jgi:hypothetical protein